VSEVLMCKCCIVGRYNVDVLFDAPARSERTSWDLDDPTYDNSSDQSHR